MKLQMYDNVNRYIDDIMDVAAISEIQNNLLISNCLRGRDGLDSSNWLMAAVKDAKGAVILVAMMTPPHNLVLYETNNIPSDEALGLLVNEIAANKTEVKGVLAEKLLACRFKEKYLSASGKKAETGKNLRIYRLDQVNDITYSSGKLRLAEQNDLFYLPHWNTAFNYDCGHGIVEISGSYERVKRLLLENALYLWEDNYPVSQAAMGRKTLNGAVVNAVYTPPYFRGKGYASSCVASLSRHLLECGFKFCSLFTDLANPVSNSIYMKIGYKPVCDYDEYFFKPKS